MLERFSAQTRHRFILLLGSLTYTGSDLVLHIDPTISALLAVILPALGLKFTPLTRQYGAGK